MDPWILNVDLHDALRGGWAVVYTEGEQSLFEVTVFTAKSGHVGVFKADVDLVEAGDLVSKRSWTFESVC